MLPCFTRSMDRKNNADFSSYFHFEETGDSEADCDPIMSWEINRGDEDDGEDNDDALSCSYDGSGTCDAAEIINGHESCDEDEDEDDDEKKEDEEEDVIHGTSYCDCEDDDDDDDEIHEHNQKSFVSFDSGQESVDEMEKNRMFWEACLAS